MASYRRRKHVDGAITDPTTHEVTAGFITDAIIPAGPGWDGGDLVASELALADRDYDQGVGRESRLRAAIRRTHRLRRSSHRLPTIPGQLTINALTTADSPYS